MIPIQFCFQTVKDFLIFVNTLLLTRQGAEEFLDQQSGIVNPGSQPQAMSSIIVLPEGVTPLSNVNMQRNAMGGEACITALRESQRITQQPSIFYGIYLSFDNLNKLVGPKEYF
jgi:hypothetical protein